MESGETIFIKHAHAKVDNIEKKNYWKQLISIFMELMRSKCILV